ERLEALRTELLAGVTHELKTPVTSISGLVQAVKDGVVEGKEAEEFLEASLRESSKMKRMVEDLLAFNRFVANTVPLKSQRTKFTECITEMVHQWKMIQEEEWDIQIQPTNEEIIIQM